LDPQRLVVRLHDPRRFRVVVGVCIVLALTLGIGLFEFGQRTAGHSITSSDHRRQALRAEVARLRVETQQLKDELARVRTGLDVDREAQALLTASLAEREARVAELSEELEFYRRILAPSEGQMGLRVQTFEVTAGEIANSYRLNFLLVQSPQRSGRAEGSLELSLRGTLRGEETSMTLQELAADAPNFEFLYFQDVLLEVILPDGFEPQMAEIELRPARANGRPVATSFPWQPRG
jgi:septal ring factor EnvC (AmiA/AmiB activator)